MEAGPKLMRCLCLVLAIVFGFAACVGEKKAGTPPVAESGSGEPRLKSDKQDTEKRRRDRKRKYFRDQQKKTLDRVKRLYEDHNK